jgi:hypothetical protein
MKQYHANALLAQKEKAKYERWVEQVQRDQEFLNGQVEEFERLKAKELGKLRIMKLNFSKTNSDSMRNESD